MDKIKCKKCQKEFYYDLQGTVYPGGKFDEDIECPYCGEINETVMTSQFVIIKKIDNDL
ncbi:MAG: hypothetical protein PHG84_05030 [Endomicrobiaceae bacterium]|nr:hypothetical protein [Endomicrobiaceae bacterium]MDD3922533.1 hypothetical protein [Endomicrobiaceae bacterium]